MKGTYTEKELPSTIELLKDMDSALELINLPCFLATQINVILTIYLFIANIKNIYVLIFSAALVWYLVKG
jgi:hypothetical protein